MFWCVKVMCVRAVCLLKTPHGVRGDKCALGAALSSCLWTLSTLLHIIQSLRLGRRLSAKVTCTVQYDGWVWIYQISHFVSSLFSLLYSLSRLSVIIGETMKGKEKGHKNWLVMCVISNEHLMCISNQQLRIGDWKCFSFRHEQDCSRCMKCPVCKIIGCRDTWVSCSLVAVDWTRGDWEACIWLRKIDKGTNSFPLLPLVFDPLLLPHIAGIAMFLAATFPALLFPPFSPIVWRHVSAVHLLWGLRAHGHTHSLFPYGGKMSAPASEMNNWVS